MGSPLYEASSVSSNTSSLQELTPRQQVERALDATLPAAGSALAQSTTHQAEAGHESLVGPVQRINDVMRDYGVQFELSEHASHVVTRIVDRDSGEVIRQIPAEEVLQVAERLSEVRGRLLSLEA